MTEPTLNRKSLVLNLGGGVFGDMGEFCATIYKPGKFRFNQYRQPTFTFSGNAECWRKLGVDFQD